jgi:hypothetical protein
MTKMTNLVGVLLTNGLMIKRGAKWTTAICACPSSVNLPPPVMGGWASSTTNTKYCSGECVMFGEPVFNEDGSAEITICGGKTLVFRKLFDMRGNNNIEETCNYTNEELIKALEEAGVVFKSN